MMRPRIDVTIDQIELAAMPPGGERRLRDAVARAVVRQLADRSAAAADSSVAGRIAGHAAAHLQASGPAPTRHADSISPGGQFDGN